MVAAQRALAWSFLELPLDMADECYGTEPPLADVLMLIVLDVAHLPGVGTMFLLMGVPLVIATHSSARRVVSVPWAPIHWSMPFCNAPRTPWHATGGINVVVVADACRSTFYSIQNVP